MIHTITLRAYPNNPKLSFHLKIFILIRSGKTFFPNKLTFTGSRDLSWIFVGEPCLSRSRWRNQMRTETASRRKANLTSKCKFKICKGNKNILFLNLVPCGKNWKKKNVSKSRHLMLQVLVLILTTLWLVLFSVSEIQLNLLSTKPIRLQ